MRYDDASQTGSFTDATPMARDDADHLAAADFGPATGNTISGTGTITGATGTDTGGNQITAIQGAGGTDTSFEGGNLQVAGQYGVLTIDAQGNYSYVRNAGTPEGVTDTFTYTLANTGGATDTAQLVINIGDTPLLANQGNRTELAGSDVVVLPAGVELSDVRVVGRDLVITLPDGSTMVIPNGAVFVPQLVIDGVAVPATNLAALLIDSEPRPAAGEQAPLSSGGNFAVPVSPLDPGVPLGDLLPPTELSYVPPDFEEIQFLDEDDAPSIGLSSVNVSEEGLVAFAALPDTAGSPDTTNSATASGAIVVSDENGDALTITLGVPSGSFTSAGVPITWAVSADGHTLTGSAGANTVITLVINDAGAYTVTLSRPIDHPNGGGEQGSNIVVPVSVSDGENINAGGAITIVVEDDSPQVTASSSAEPILVVDETVLGDNASASFAANFTAAFGADGPAVGSTVAYALGINAGTTGLVDSATGAAVVLSVESGQVVGRAGAGGAVVFTVSVSAAGVVTLDQQRAVIHNDPTDHDEPGASAATFAADNLVTLTASATDRDGDTASATVNLGLNLRFEDDGPTAAVNGQAALDTIVLDETRPEGTDTAGGVAPTGDASATANFADNFVTPANFGADGPGSVAYSLVLSANGIGSGLFALDSADTSGGDGDGIGQGAEITLSQSGNVVTGSAGGTNYFTITIDAATGVVTFTQLAAIWHPTPGTSFDEAAVLNTATAANLQVRQTVTDADGDTATAAVAIGRSVFSIQDDGPDATVNAAATLDTVVLDETRPEGSDTAGGGAPSGDASATANFGDNFGATADFGSDGPGSVTYQLLLSANGIGSGLFALQPADTSPAGVDGDGIGQGAEITLSQVGNTITGSAGGTDYFTIAIDPATGVVTFTQLAAIWHPTPGTSFDEAAALNTAAAANVQVQQTITDADGDTDTATVNVGRGVFSIQDDGPNAEVNGQATLDTVVLDESRPEGTDTAGGASPTGDSSATLDFGDNFVGGGDFGEDGPGSVSYSLLLSANGIGSGLFALQPADTAPVGIDGDGIGQGAEITLSQVGNTITGSAGGTDYFTIAIDPATGVVTFTQLAPIWHPTPGASYDEAAVLNTAAAANVQVVQTVTDADGDTDTAAVNIGRGVFSIQDDGPNAEVNGQAGLDTVVLDETRPEGTDTAGGVAPNGDASATADFGDNFVGGGDFGEDGPGSVSYSLLLSANGIGSGLFALQPADTAPAGIDGDGIGQGAEITLSQVGNTITGSAGGTNYFTISIDPATGVVTFTQLAAIWHPTPGSSHDEAATLSTAAAANVQVVQTVTDADGDTDTASINVGQGVFSIQDDGPNAAVNTGATLDTIVLDETRAEGTDTPGGTLPNGDASATANFADNFTGPADHGEDGPGTVNYTLLLSANGIASGLFALEPNDNSAAGVDGDGYGQGASITLSQVGNTITGSAGGTNYFTISIDNSTGVVTFTQLAPIWHPVPGASFDEAAALNTAAASNIQVVQTITDADGDSDTAAINVGQGVFSIQDDGPSATNEAQQNVPEGGVINAGFDFDAGEDGGGVTHINGTLLVFDPVTGFSQSIDVGPGSIMVKADGTYRFTAENPAANGPVNGTFTVTDNDGDTITANWSFNITDANTPTAGAADARLDDDGLVVPADPVLEAGNGDVDANIGEVAPVNLNEAIFHGALNASFGGDGAGSISFAAMHNTFGQVGTERVVYTWDAASRTLLAEVAATDAGGNAQARSGTDLFRLVLEAAPSVNYTLTLLDNVLHVDDGADNETGVALVTPLSFTITDSDNSPPGGVNGTLNITFNDDTPTATVNGQAALDTIVLDETRAEGTDTPGGTLPNGDASATAAFADNFAAVTDYGADGPGSTSYSLVLSANGIASGLFALQPADTSAAGVDGDGIGQGASITLSQVGNTITGSAGGTNYFTISIDSTTGVVTFTQLAAIWHPTPGSSFDEAAVLNTVAASNIQVRQSVTDADGDTANATIDVGRGVFSIQDDGPDAAVNLQATLDTLVLDETRPLGEDSDDGDVAPGGLATVQANFADNFVASIDHGADGPGAVTYSLFLSGANVNSGLYALEQADISAGDGDPIGRGAQIVLNQSGNTITGSVGGTNYFTITIDPATGIVTFTQLANIWHSNVASDDEAATLTAAANSVQVRQTVTDADGDSDTAAVDVSTGVFTIQDDGPEVFTPSPVSATNGNTAPVIANLNLDIGTDGFGQLLFNTAHDGDAAVDDDGNPLTLGGQALFYQVNGNILTAETAGGAVGFTITLNTNGTYTFDVNGVISNGTETSFTNLTSSAAGNVDFRLIGADTAANNAPNTDIILSAHGETQATGSVNTDSDSIGVDSQAVNPGSGVRIDLVTNVETVVGPGDPANGPQGFHHSGHVTTTHFEQFIPQVQGNPDNTVNIVVTAILADEDHVYDNTPYNADGTTGIETGESKATINKVVVNDYSNETDPVLLNTYTFTSSGTQGGYTVSFVNGSAVIEGLGAEDQYEIDTASPFSAVVVESPGGPNNWLDELDPDPAAGNQIANTTNFDLGIFSIGTVSAGTDIVQEFDIIAVDRDGDPEAATITTTITPVPPAVTLLASDSQEQQLQKTAANSNNMVFTAAVAAAGMAATSAAAQDAPVDDSGTSAKSVAPVADAISVDDGGSSGLSSLSALANDSSDSTADQSAADHGGSARAAARAGNAGELSGGDDVGHAFSALSQGTDAPASQVAVPSHAADISMPSAEALIAAGLAGEGQPSASVESIVADALQGGNGPDIDALLASLPAQANGGNAALEALASTSGAGVPAWDMGHGGGFTFDAATIITAEALVLHHDAVQPAANG